MDLEALRSQWTENLRRTNGDAWMEKHAALLDLQWSFLVECHFLD
jgi:hypothetical protein